MLDQGKNGSAGQFWKCLKKLLYSCKFILIKEPAKTGRLELHLVLVDTSESKTGLLFQTLFDWLLCKQVGYHKRGPHESHTRYNMNMEVMSEAWKACVPHKSFLNLFFPLAQWYPVAQ